ncbi:MAG: pyridoxal phosphate-dependent aminotransferase [Bacillota bacterium]
MYLSRRVSAISPSPTLAIDAKAKQMQAEGKDVVNFGVGEPDYDTPAHIKESAVKALEAGFTKYTPVAGIPDLKQAIAAKFKRDSGLDYSLNQIVVSVGAKHALYNAYMALCDEGDEVIIQHPCWVSYPEIIRLAGAVPVAITTDERKGFRMTAEEIEKRINPRTRVINLNSPSNPTGVVYPPEELEAIADVAVRRDLFIVTDEIYDQLVYDGVKQVSIASFGPEVKRRTVVINGVSKTYAMTGWRIGWAAAESELAKAMGDLQGHVTSNPTSLSQKAAVTALNGPQEPIKAMVEEFKRRRDYMYARVAAMPGFSCRRPDGAFYLFPGLAGLVGKSVGGRVIRNGDDLSQAILEQALVAIVPGSGFGSPQHVRLSYATSMERIKEGLDRIEALLKGAS